MKKNILIISLILFSLNVFSQFIEDETSSTPKKTNYSEFKTSNILKTNPLAIISSPMFYASEYRIIWEHKIDKKQTFFIGGSYLGKGMFLRLQEDAWNASNPNNNVFYVAKGYRAQGGYKFYYNKKAPKGFYVGPFISYLSTIITEKNAPLNSDYLQITYFNINLVFGHQFVIGDIFTIDFCSGWGYKSNLYFQKNPNGASQDIFGDINNPLQNVKFVFNFNFGYKF